MNKDRFLAFIREQVSENQLREMTDAVYAAYSRAEVVAKAEIKALGHERMRSYSRRELCNDVLAQYGEARHTNPKGEKYGLVQFSDMNMLTFCVDPTQTIRPANYRKELSRVNQIFEDVHPDLFKDDSELIRSSLHTCLMIINPKAHEKEQKRPRDIQLVVPYTDFKGFHLKISLNEWLESYQEKAATTVDPWPSFRKEIIDIEKLDQDDE